MPYSVKGDARPRPTTQASMRPFKLAHESTLDSISVLLLMAIFISDIHKDTPAFRDNTDFPNFHVYVFIAR